jgi:flagellar basal body rod protein FlgG
MFTGRNLDVAVQGRGWLAVQLPDGTEAYTRAGSLDVDVNGLLQTKSGYSVLGDGGPLNIPPDNTIEIAPDGTISVVSDLWGTKQCSAQLAASSWSIRRRLIWCVGLMGFSVCVMVSQLRPMRESEVSSGHSGRQ